MRFLFASLAAAALLAACSDNKSPAAAHVSPETACAKQGFAIGTPDFDACVKREQSYRRMEDFRKESDQRELYRDFDRARRF